AAPDRAIQTVARAVEAHADRRTLEPVLAEAARHVRVVMLDGDCLQAIAPLALVRIARGCVVRMKVVHDAFGFDLEQPLEVAERVFERALSGKLLQVAEMRAGRHVALAAEREYALQISA